MQYWLIYNENDELVGYSTYKQFKGQICCYELPSIFKEKELQKEKSLLEKSFLTETNEKILEYLEEIASGESTTLSEQEFKDLCLKRKNTRKKLKEN